jgi:hypothetical protein
MFAPMDAKWIESPGASDDAVVCCAVGVDARKRVDAVGCVSTRLRMSVCDVDCAVVADCGSASPMAALALVGVIIGGGLVGEATDASSPVAQHIITASCRSQWVCTSTSFVCEGGEERVGDRRMS